MYIRANKRGHRTYYYIVESVRKGGEGHTKSYSLSWYSRNSS